MHANGLNTTVFKECPGRVEDFITTFYRVLPPSTYRHIIHLFPWFELQSHIISIHRVIDKRTAVRYDAQIGHVSGLGCATTL